MKFTHLANRLLDWNHRLEAPELYTCSLGFLLPDALSRIPRTMLEKARDRLDRAQEREQFSSEEDQQDLAELVKALDEILQQCPAN